MKSFNPLELFFILMLKFLYIWLVWALRVGCCVFWMFPLYFDLLVIFNTRSFKLLFLPNFDINLFSKVLLPINQVTGSSCAHFFRWNIDSSPQRSWEIHESLSVYLSTYHRSIIYHLSMHPSNHLLSSVFHLSIINHEFMLIHPNPYQHDRLHFHLSPFSHL